MLWRGRLLAGCGRVIGSVLTLVPLSSCLPADTRPEAANVLVTMKAGETGVDATLRWATEDGWTISVDRLLLSVGHASLRGDDCNGYQGGSYGRILDIRAGDTQKVALIFGLGQCDLAFRLRPAPGDALLGVGVSEADKLMMRAAASDPWVARQGTSFYVDGRAARGDGEVARDKTFAWSFREQVRYDECSLHGPPLTAGDVRSVVLRVHPEALFERQDGGALRFDPFADADEDGDGIVSLSELGRRPSGDGFTSLGDEVYRGRFPRTVRVDDAERCAVELGAWTR
jgi:hypothetical protein